jgi:hypothetical protein
MTVQTRRDSRSAPALRRRRKALLRQLPALEGILRGSLIERYKRCGKPGCKCVHGPGHGPQFYLSVSHAGERPQMQYVPSNYHDEVSQRLNEYRQCRKILDEICEINFELLRRRERFE